MSAENGRPMRGCDICGGVDDHPRHVFDATGVQESYQTKPEDAAIEAVYARDDLDARTLVAVVNEMNDVTVQTRHMDCCAERGCPTGDCDEVLKRTKNAHGHDLVKAITGEKA